MFVVMGSHDAFSGTAFRDADYKPIRDFDLCHPFILKPHRQFTGQKKTFTQFRRFANVYC